MSAFNPDGNHRSDAISLVRVGMIIIMCVFTYSLVSYLTLYIIKVIVRYFCFRPIINVFNETRFKQLDDVGSPCCFQLPIDDLLTFAVF